MLEGPNKWRNWQEIKGLNSDNSAQTKEEYGAMLPLLHHEVCNEKPPYEGLEGTDVPVANPAWGTCTVRTLAVRGLVTVHVVDNASMPPTPTPPYRPNETVLVRLLRRSFYMKESTQSSCGTKRSIPGHGFRNGPDIRTSFVRPWPVEENPPA